MRAPRVMLALVLALVVSPGAAQPPEEIDLERSAWRFRRRVTLPEAGAFAALPVPPEVGASSQPDLRDLRLVDAGGMERPYFVDHAVPRKWRQSHPGRLVDQRSTPTGPPEEERGASEWVVDLGEVRAFDTIVLSIPGRGFAKRFRIEGSTNRTSWDLVGQDVPVFEAPWAGGVRHTTFHAKQRVEARYLRLKTPDDRRSPRVEVTGVSVSVTRRTEGEEWRRQVGLLPEGSGPPSRYLVEVPEGFPFDTATLVADDPAFSRRVRLYERRGGSRPGRRPLAEAQLYRLRLPEQELAADQRTLTLSTAPEQDELILEIEDGDSPPLRNPRLEIAGSARRLVFPAKGGEFTLFYGNEDTRAPVYDIAHLEGRLRWSPSLVSAALGAESANPRFQRPTPFPFTSTRGAALDITRWATARPVTIRGTEDIFTVTVHPEDLARLRPDLGDLRIADASDTQVPFILESRASEARLPLAIEPVSARGRRDRKGRSRYRLTARDRLSGDAIALPLAALELYLAEPFFERPVRLLAPAAGSSGRGERKLASGTLSRRPSGRPRENDEAAPPLVLSLSENRTAALVLEIQDGDNAPLTLQRVDAVIQVPRLTFKAMPGEYRLLLGNPDARSPRYDLDALRRELLAYSALPVEAGAAMANRAHRRRLSDYFENAPPTLLLWGTMILGVAVLLGLVARIVRQQPADGDGAGESASTRRSPSDDTQD